MSRVVILQPGYLPWLGFFEQMWRSDFFVLYDDVQFDKNGWRNRNRIKTAQGAKWLSVPVHVTLGDRIKDVVIDNSTDWRRKHLKSIGLSYSKSAYYKDYYPLVEEILLREWKYLIDVDVCFITALSRALGINKKVIFSSELNVQEGGKVGRLIKICKTLGAKVFYEGCRGKEYIDDNIFQKEGIRVEYQDYVHLDYPQLHGGFIPYLSIIDLLFNNGPKSLDILTHQGSLNTEVGK